MCSPREAQRKAHSLALSQSVFLLFFFTCVRLHPGRQRRIGRRGRFGAADAIRRLVLIHRGGIVAHDRFAAHIDGRLLLDVGAVERLRRLLFRR